MSESKIAKVTSGHKNQDQNKVIRRCLRKGAKICYTNKENITVLRKIPEKNIQISSTDEKKDSYGKIDSYSSGESLFKTFTFEQTRDVDDPETVKCMEFWKSIIQKNLMPIKCTLLECDKQCPRHHDEKEKIITHNETDTNDLQEKFDKKSIIPDATEIWSHALKEIRQKKLHHLKLYATERCKYCSDPFSKYALEELAIEDKEEQTKQITSLNEWKPRSQQDSRVSSSKRLTKPRILEKFRKISATQTNESLMGEGKLANLEFKNSEIGKFPSVLEQKVIQEFRKKSNVSTASTETQVTNIRCSCDSEGVNCPHKIAAKNSIRSFIETARKSIKEDASKDNFSSKVKGSCICSQSDPGLNIICSTQPCSEKTPKVEIQESSSDFNIDKISEEDSFSCVCNKGLEVVCTSELCENRESQGSMVQGYIQKMNNERESRDCSVNKRNLRRKSSKCICGKNLPWALSTCQSWSCSHRKKKLMNNRKEQRDEKIVQKMVPVREITSTCVCQKSYPWQYVDCICDKCMNNPNTDLKSGSRISPVTKRLSKNISEQKILRTGSSRKNIESDENIEQNEVQLHKTKNCKCSTSSAWKHICTTPACKNYTPSILNNVKKNSLNNIKSEIIDYTDKSDSICHDNTINESLCRPHECSERGISVSYTPLSLSSKEESKDNHLKCMSEEYRMQEIDESCVCDSKPDRNCNNSGCETSHQEESSKKLNISPKPLKYDSRCICKVRGLPTTREVSCKASDCPLKIKPLSLLKDKKPTTNHLFNTADEQKNKCFCNGNNLSVPVNCHSTTCRQKNKLIQSNNSAQNAQPEICICNDHNKSESEVICRQIQCEKIFLGKEGILLNDKCVCTNSEKLCDEPACQSAININIDEGSKRDYLKKDRPYCYICGHYNCGVNEKTFSDKKPCSDISNLNNTILPK